MIDPHSSRWPQLSTFAAAALVALCAAPWRGPLDNSAQEFGSENTGFRVVDAESLFMAVELRIPGEEFYTFLAIAGLVVVLLWKGTAVDADAHDHRVLSMSALPAVFMTTITVTDHFDRDPNLAPFVTLALAVAIMVSAWIRARHLPEPAG